MFCMDCNGGGPLAGWLVLDAVECACADACAETGAGATEAPSELQPYMRSTIVEGGISLSRDCGRLNFRSITSNAVLMPCALLLSMLMGNSAIVDVRSERKHHLALE